MRYGLLLFLLLCETVLAQTNRALIVSIGTYPPDSGWETIHAGNDARLVGAHLSAHHFLKPNIALLSDTSATKAAITEALRRLCRTAEAGDAVYLHFSCHGQQMMDDNGDEEDGLDEALIPYDAGFWYLPGKYEGENHLRDDELGEWIHQIRRKITERGRLTVVLDACHSGTGNRENEPQDYVRGTAAVFAPDGYLPREGRHPELSLKLRPERTLAPTAVFSACLANEINYEYYDRALARYAGLLTVAFLETEKVAGGKLSVKLFAEELKKRMAALTAHRKGRKQTPYMECSHPEVYLKTGHEAE